jgi:hypothetical protein
MSIVTEIRRELERRDLPIGALTYSYNHEQIGRGTYFRRTMTVSVSLLPRSLGALDGLTLMEVCGMDPVLGLPVEAIVSGLHSRTSRGGELEAELEFTIVEVPRPAGTLSRGFQEPIRPGD